MAVKLTLRPLARLLFEDRYGNSSEPKIIIVGVIGAVSIIGTGVMTFHHFSERANENRKAEISREIAPSTRLSAATSVDNTGRLVANHEARRYELVGPDQVVMTSGTLRYTFDFNSDMVVNHDLQSGETLITRYGEMANGEVWEHAKETGCAMSGTAAGQRLPAVQQFQRNHC